MEVADSRRWWAERQSRISQHASHLAQLESELHGNYGSNHSNQNTPSISASPSPEKKYYDGQRYRFGNAFGGVNASSANLNHNGPGQHGNHGNGRERSNSQQHRDRHHSGHQSHQNHPNHHNDRNSGGYHTAGSGHDTDGEGHRSRSRTRKDRRHSHNDNTKKAPIPKDYVLHESFTRRSESPDPKRERPRIEWFLIFIIYAISLII